MGSFNKIKSQEANSDVVREYDIYELEDPTPVLLIRYAGRSNRALTKRMQRRNSARRGLTITGEQADAINLKNAIELYPGPEGCIDGFKVAPQYDNGSEVPFSDCQKFLEAIPDYAMRRIMLFAMSPENFVERPEEMVIEEDREEVGKD